MRILLIEDDAMIGRSLVRGLENQGMTVDWVRTGADGHAALTSDKDEHALVLLDLGLPEMTGLDFVSLLRKEQCAIPVILVTASAIGVDRSLARQLGVSTILSKPFDFLDFKKAFQPHVEESVGQRQIAPASVQTSTNN